MHLPQQPSLSKIDPQFRPQINLIIKACPVSPQQAYESLLLNDFETERAIAALKTKHSRNRIEEKLMQSIGFEEQDYDSDQEYMNFARYCNSPTQMTFYEKYPVNIEYIRPQNQIKVRSNAKGILSKQVFPFGKVNSIQEALCASYFECQPVLLIITDLAPQNRFKIEQMLKDQKMRFRFEKEFVSLAIDSKKYELEYWLKPYLSLQQALNNLLILRINLYGEIELIRLISFDQDELNKKLQRAKSETIRGTIDDNHIKYKHKMNKEGKYWKRPSSYKQKEEEKNIQKKLWSNQKLRKQQEQIYRQMETEAHLPKTQQSTIPKHNLQDIQQKRTILRQSLTVYDQGEDFKVRVPSGKQLILKVATSQKVDYLYKWVESREEDLGFEEDGVRKFDLFSGYGGRECLSDKRQEAIGQYFSGPSLVVVRQKE